MKKFIDKHFLLDNAYAKRLYHDFAKLMPIIDYHCHLPPEQIAKDTIFENITQLWLYGDHYKWRAMRASGVAEKYCTGNASDWEKFQKWSETIPCAIRNPLYHWTHLELQRYFDIHEILNESSAKKIYDECNAKIQTPEYSVRNLLRKMNVRMICTTDDPVDSLEHHAQLEKENFEIAVLPTFRPDAAMQVDHPETFNFYLNSLEEASNISITGLHDYLAALKKRHDFFGENGCSISDHGLEKIYAEDYTEKELVSIFSKIRSGGVLDEVERQKFKSGMLIQFAEWDWEKHWVQQYHLGAMRNNNSRMLKQAGSDAGCDSIGDFSQARSLSKFLDRLDSNNKLTKTILYNLNPADNELMVTITGNFNDGSFPGKIQWGSAWWFLDQKDGIVRQLDTLSSMGLISKFVGMVTDSRSFLSYPRHEYFRRVVCNLFGKDVENGELPNEMDQLGKLIQDICFYNARNYFNWQYLEAG